MPEKGHFTAEGLRRMCEANPVGADGKRGGGTLDLRGADLSGGDFRNLDLRDADLSGANIEGAGFSACRLEGAVLRDAAGMARFEASSSLSGADVAGLDLQNWGADAAAILAAKNWHLAQYRPYQLEPIGVPPTHNDRALRRDFRGYSFTKRNLSGFDFHGARLEGANFAEADLSLADLEEADLEDAELKLADLNGAKVSAGQVRSARNWVRAFLAPGLYEELKLPIDHFTRYENGDFRECDFRGFDFRNNELVNANFRGAILISADLSGQDLSGVEFEGANLCEANLRGAKLEQASGLEAWQLRGADVTGAALPPKIAEFKGLEQVAKIAPAAAKQFLVMIAACLYCWLTIAGTTDVALILGSATLPLPVVQTPIRITGFYWFAPLVLVTVFLYFQVNLHRMWEALAKLPAVFPDGRRLDEHVYPWLLIQKVRGRYKRLRGEYTFTPQLENRLGSALAYGVTPATLLAFLARALVKHDAWLTGLHIALCTLALLIALLCHRSAVDALEGAPTVRGWRYLLRSPSIRACGVCLLACVALWFGAARRLATSGAFLADAELSVKPDGWVDGQKDISRVKGARLEGADLRNANLYGAFLVKADLSYADLSGADLRAADLRGAVLDGANLLSADLASTNLQGALLYTHRLDGKRLRESTSNWVLAEFSDPQGLGLPRDHNARVRRRDFRGYDRISNAKFRQADLAGVNFEGVNLSTADLRGADLSGAILRGCNLHEARLDGARLEKADLRGADLSRAGWFTEAQLREAVLGADTKLPPAFQHLLPQTAKKTP